MLFGVSSGIPNVIIHAKFHVDRLRGFWAARPPKVPFPILIGTTLTTVLHYRADCDKNNKRKPSTGSSEKTVRAKVREGVRGKEVKYELCVLASWVMSPMSNNLVLEESVRRLAVIQEEIC